VEAAGVEPASAKGSAEISTCVEPCSVRHRVRPGHRRPAASRLVVSSSSRRHLRGPAWIVDDSLTCLRRADQESGW